MASASAGNGAVPETRKETDPAFDPFRRHDQYGMLGLKPQPWYEYIRLGLLALIVLPLKLLGFILTVSSYYVICKLAFLIPANARMPVIVALGRFHCRLSLLWLGFVSVKWVPAEGAVETGKPAKEDVGQGPVEEAVYAAVIGNHVSPCDVLVMMSRYFPSFVAKSSVATSPLVGAISQYLDCVFVDIKAKAGGNSMGMSTALRTRMEEIASGARPGMRPMCIFPEGTTTNGRYIIPFKTGAFLAGVPVKPHILRYSTLPLSPAWDTIDVRWLLFLVLANLVHTVTITELPVYVPSAEEKTDPKLFAENVRQYMLRHSSLQPSSSTYPDQLAYNKLAERLTPEQRAQAEAALEAAEKKGQ